MNFNIYINGVGGQGVGLLSAVLGEGLLKAGYKTMGADTHGLAQRHGSVSSHIKIGDNVYYPLIDENCADLVVSLERLEALRAAEDFLAPKGTLIFYDSVYQPALTRTGQNAYPDISVLKEAVKKKSGFVHRVFLKNLTDYRKQNTALLGKIAALKILPKLDSAVLRDLLSGYLKYDREENLKIYDLLFEEK